MLEHTEAKSEQIYQKLFYKVESLVRLRVFVKSVQPL